MAKTTSSFSLKIRKEIAEFERTAKELELYARIPEVVRKALQAEKVDRKILAKVIKTLEGLIDTQVFEAHQGVKKVIAKPSPLRTNEPQKVEQSLAPTTLPEQVELGVATKEEALAYLLSDVASHNPANLKAAFTLLGGHRVKFIKKVDKGDGSDPQTKEYKGSIRSFTSSPDGVKLMVKTDQHFLESVLAADCDLE